MPFQKGNQLAKGHKGSKKVALLRKAALDSASPEMAQKAMLALYKFGMDGDTRALCEWLSRIGVRADAASMMDDVVEEAARKIIEVVWGPDAATLQQDRGIGSSKN